MAGGCHWSLIELKPPLGAGDGRWFSLAKHQTGSPNGCQSNVLLFDLEADEFCPKTKLIREARAASSLDHSNILRPLRDRREPDLSFIVMQSCGKTLHRN